MIETLLKLFGITSVDLIEKGVKAIKLVELIFGGDKQKQEDEITQVIAQLRNGMIPTVLTQFLKSDTTESVD